MTDTGNEETNTPRSQPLPAQPVQYVPRPPTPVWIPITVVITVLLIGLILMSYFIDVS